ncbi:hypothetical protein [Sporomusa acidovorans]|uniref:FlxA-like protein n=1 Tax=Sporomusa acidovorans (strain ATCC 49682 / DSM 3132 / Mol) TaxID=1123286 RepID=A0ABZ3J2E3_SPOA4|nr:hypothetical protein [Sporomusa acidovorans]OZC24100.1 hypothetical protein SPACI_02470 [Sporomusa acidovorans DSM 3132]SDF69028.1 hypothetical protein SAMN04488499_106814 [Sporomusa acidovorans]
MSTIGQEDNQQNNRTTGQTTKDQQQADETIPLSETGRQLSGQIDKQIQQFGQQLKSKSNQELKQISEQLEAVEREMLLAKIDNQLQTIKETAFRPEGDIAPISPDGGSSI